MKAKLKKLVDFINEKGYEIKVKERRVDFTDFGSYSFSEERETALEHSLKRITIYKVDKTKDVIKYLERIKESIEELEDIKNGTIFNQDIIEIEEYLKT